MAVVDTAKNLVSLVSWSDMPDEVWQNILRNLSIHDRLQLELVSTRFRNIMPYDNLGVITPSVIASNETAWMNEVHRFFWLLFLKSRTNRVKLTGIICRGSVKERAKLWIVFSSICPTNIRIIDCINDSRETKNEDALNSELLSLISLGRFPNIRKLCLQTIEGDIYILTAFSASVPKLQFLQTYGWCPFNFPCNLQSLQLCLGNVQPPELMHAMKACIENMQQFSLNFAGEVCLPPMPQVKMLTLKCCNVILLAGSNLGSLFPSVQHLTLSTMDLINPPGDFYLLRSLNLEVTRSINEFIQRCTAPSVEHLRIVYSNCTDDTLAYIAERFPRLRKLQILEITCTGSTLKQLFQACDSLQECTLDFGTAQFAFQASHFAALAYAPLSLAHCTIDLWGARDWESFVRRALEALAAEIELTSGQLRRAAVLQVNIGHAHQRDTFDNLLPQLESLGFSVSIGAERWFGDFRALSC